MFHKISHKILFNFYTNSNETPPWRMYFITFPVGKTFQFGSLARCVAINLLFMFLHSNFVTTKKLFSRMAFCAPQNIPEFIKNSLEINLVYFAQRSRTRKKMHMKKICERFVSPRKQKEELKNCNRHKVFGAFNWFLPKICFHGLESKAKRSAKRAAEEDFCIKHSLTWCLIV